MQSFEGRHKINYLEHRRRITLAVQHRLGWLARYGFVIVLATALVVAGVITHFAIEREVFYIPKFFAAYPVAITVFVFSTVTSLVLIIGMTLYWRYVSTRPRVAEFAHAHSGDIRIDETGIHYDTPAFTQSYRWSAIDDVKFYNRDVLIFSDVTMHVISTDNFENHAEREDFIETVRGYMNTPAGKPQP